MNTDTELGDAEAKFVWVRLTETDVPGVAVVVVRVSIGVEPEVCEKVAEEDTLRGSTRLIEYVLVPGGTVIIRDCEEEETT